MIGTVAGAFQAKRASLRVKKMRQTKKLYPRDIAMVRDAGLPASSLINGRNRVDSIFSRALLRFMKASGGAQF